MSVKTNGADVCFALVVTLIMVALPAIAHGTHTFAERQNATGEITQFIGNTGGFARPCEVAPLQPGVRLAGGCFDKPDPAAIAAAWEANTPRVVDILNENIPRISISIKDESREPFGAHYWVTDASGSILYEGDVCTSIGPLQVPSATTRVEVAILPLTESMEACKIFGNSPAVAGTRGTITMIWWVRYTLELEDATV
ncbi:MAG: hypothetical protein HY556_04100 [Euryarchaeota archaeon]|nr:hypothetical protein [Euryarchaeota archaeon]